MKFPTLELVSIIKTTNVDQNGLLFNLVCTECILIIVIFFIPSLSSSDLGADLEIRSFMIHILRFGVTDPGAGIRLKTIQILKIKVTIMSKSWETFYGKLTRYSKEKILIKRRIPKSDTRRRADMEISIYKVLNFLQFHLHYVLIKSTFRGAWISILLIKV